MMDDCWARFTGYPLPAFKTCRKRVLVDLVGNGIILPMSVKSPRIEGLLGVYEFANRKNVSEFVQGSMPNFHLSRALKADEYSI
jgi:hypothetical protein